METITRPALRYYGGKWMLAPWIISFFPPHDNYVEPCGGAASVLLRKVPSKLETYNDIDGRLVNFFRVLRDRTDELVQRIRLTPWAREEWKSCVPKSDDPLEDARRTFVLSWQSFSAFGSSWRSQTRCETRQRTAPLDGTELDHLFSVAERLRIVQIEHMDALECFQHYDNKNTLTYFDPPYLPLTRSVKSVYSNETNAFFHYRAAKVLKEAKGYVIISGYRSELYKQLFEDCGWRRFDHKSTATNGGGSRVESVWLSPNIK